MQNTLDFGSSHCSLVSIPSLVDLLALEEAQPAHHQGHELRNITTFTELPHLSIGLLSQSQIADNLLMSDLDNVAFNGKSSLLIPKALCSLEDGSQTTIEEEKPTLLDSQERAKKSGSGCKCKKTGCLKMYCECFYSGRLCTEECSCHQCCNHEARIEDIHRARKQAKLRHSSAFMPNEMPARKPCNCRKSQCQKKYCECYNAGLACTEKCKCEECLNGAPHTHSAAAMEPQY